MEKSAESDDHSSAGIEYNLNADNKDMSVSDTQASHSGPNEQDLEEGKLYDANLAEQRASLKACQDQLEDIAEMFPQQRDAVDITKPRERERLWLDQGNDRDSKRRRFLEKVKPSYSRTTGQFMLLNEMSVWLSSRSADVLLDDMAMKKRLETFDNYDEDMEKQQDSIQNILADVTIDKSHRTYLLDKLRSASEETKIYEENYVKALQSQLRKTRVILKDTIQQHEHLEKSIDVQLQNLRYEYEPQIKNLEETNKSWQRTLEEMRPKLADAEQTIREMNAAKKMTDGTISELHSQIDGLKFQLERKNRQLVSKSNDIELANKSNTSLQERIAIMTHAADEKSRDWNIMSTRLDRTLAENSTLKKELSRTKQLLDTHQKNSKKTIHELSTDLKSAHKALKDKQMLVKVAQEAAVWREKHQDGIFANILDKSWTEMCGILFGSAFDGRDGELTNEEYVNVLSRNALLMKRLGREFNFASTNFDLESIDIIPALAQPEGIHTNEQRTVAIQCGLSRAATRQLRLSMRQVVEQAGMAGMLTELTEEKKFDDEMNQFSRNIQDHVAQPATRVTSKDIIAAKEAEIAAEASTTAQASDTTATTTRTTDVKTKTKVSTTMPHDKMMSAIQTLMQHMKPASDNTFLTTPQDQPPVSAQSTEAAVDGEKEVMDDNAAAREAYVLVCSLQESVQSLTEENAKMKDRVETYKIRVGQLQAQNVSLRKKARNSVFEMQEAYAADDELESLLIATRPMHEQPRTTRRLAEEEAAHVAESAAADVMSSHHAPNDTVSHPNSGERRRRPASARPSSIADTQTMSKKKKKKPKSNRIDISPLNPFMLSESDIEKLRERLLTEHVVVPVQPRNPEERITVSNFTDEEIAQLRVMLGIAPAGYEPTVNEYDNKIRSVPGLTPFNRVPMNFDHIVMGDEPKKQQAPLKHPQSISRPVSRADRNARIIRTRPSTAALLRKKKKQRPVSNTFTLF